MRASVESTLFPARKCLAMTIRIRSPHHTHLIPFNKAENQILLGPVPVRQRLEL